MTSTPTPTTTELPTKCGCGGDIQLPDGCMKYFTSDQIDLDVEPMRLMWSLGLGAGNTVFESPDQAEMAFHLESNGLTRDQARLILLSGPSSRELEIEGVAWQMVLPCLQDARINYQDAESASHLENVAPGDTWARVDMIITPSLGHHQQFSARFEMERDAANTPWHAQVTIVSSSAPSTQTMFDVSFKDGTYVAKFGAIIGKG